MMIDRQFDVYFGSPALLNQYSDDIIAGEDHVTP